MYEMNEETTELYDKGKDLCYPLLRKINHRDNDLLFKTFDGRYINAEKKSGEWFFDDQQKEYKEWYGTDIAIGGYIVETIPATIDEVFSYLSKSMDNEMIDEYFSNMTKYGKTGKDSFPQDYNFIACYAVTGGSEGHYVHVDIITDEHRKNLFLAKTFKGMDHAWKIAAHIGKMLNA
jgi:hypothetical protein